MQLSDIDLKQLRIFVAVVECAGFSAAEAILNISQSTISTNISDLEHRLGYRVCERGRRGFVLTDRGKELYERTTQLLETISDFETGAFSLRGVLAGRLTLAMIDNLITDPVCPVVTALSLLHSRNGAAPRITIDVLPPAAIEHAVAVGNADVGLSIAEKRLPMLRYRRLYGETDVLVCGAGHPLFDVTNDEKIRRGIRNATKVVRTFLNQNDFFQLSAQAETIRGVVTNIEAAAFLVLAGTHIGFLPLHYVQKWIDEGRMRTLMPEKFKRESEIMLIQRMDASTEPSVVQHFVDALVRTSK